MLGFRLVLSAPQKRALVKALAVARRQGNRRVITRLLALLSIAENRLSVTEIARLLRADRFEEAVACARAMIASAARAGPSTGRTG